MGPFNQIVKTDRLAVIKNESIQVFYLRWPSPRAVTTWRNVAFKSMSQALTCDISVAAAGTFLRLAGDVSLTNVNSINSAHVLPRTNAHNLIHRLPWLWPVSVATLFTVMYWIYGVSSRASQEGFQGDVLPCLISSISSPSCSLFSQSTKDVRGLNHLCCSFSSALWYMEEGCAGEGLFVKRI